MYQNYGDVNFFERGRLVDTEHSDTEIQVLYCEPYPDEDDLYLFADCTVCLDDGWIDWDAIEAWSGSNYTDCNSDVVHALAAIAAIEHYGAENFSSPYDGFRFSKKEIQDKLKYYLIAYDNLVTE